MHLKNSYFNFNTKLVDYKFSNSAKASSKDFIADLNASFLVRSTPASFKSSTGLSLPPEDKNLK